MSFRALVDRIVSENDERVVHQESTNSEKTDMALVERIVAENVAHQELTNSEKINLTSTMKDDEISQSDGDNNSYSNDNSDRNDNNTPIDRLAKATGILLLNNNI